MSRHRPAVSLLNVLLCLSALPAEASPATDLFQAASGALSANYYGWSETDRPALISRYAATLDAQCAPLADACTFDQGRAVVREMLLQLHDPHTNIRDAEGAERLREIQDDLTVPRTGLRVVKTALGLLVVGVMPGSPAQAAGVQRFDLLTSVNGKTAVNGQTAVTVQTAVTAQTTATGQTTATIQGQVQGNPAQGVSGQADAPALADAPETVTAATLSAVDPAGFVRLERRQFPIVVEISRAGRSLALTLPTAALRARDVPILSWQPGVGGPVAVIEYPTFLPADSAELFLKTLRQAQAGGAAGLVIDLRYNGGGRLDQCVQAASAFVPTFYQARWLPAGIPGTSQPAQNSQAAQSGRPQTSWEYAALNGQITSPANVRKALFAPLVSVPAPALWHDPVALLIGENTASCAEVFGHFAHMAGGLLVGQPTKGVMNSGVNFFPLPDHGVMSVTMLRAYDLNGQALPGRLQPDVDVPADLEALTARGQDTALQVALGAVQSQLAAGNR